MDIEELDDFFDNDEEFVDNIHNMRTYTVKERKDHYNSLREKEFFDRFQLSKNTVNDLLLPQIMDILSHETYHYHEIDARTQLLLALRYYATGSIHKTTSGRIVKRVTDALLTLLPNYIKSPQNIDEQRQCQQKFYLIRNFPRVLGAIDCTHVRIASPGGDNAETYRNRKGYFSLNVQAVCDSNNKITDIVARWPGSSHDSHIFRNSAIKVRFERGEFGDAILLGDSGYPLTNYLMTPIANPHTRAEELYNHSHVATRTIIERTFGIWKRRFPILSTGIRCKIALAQKIIVVTAILHNIAVTNRDNINDDFDGENVDNEHIFENIEQRGVVYNRVQQRYIDYFETLLV
ncbi:hypothetical protein NQ317_017585, partial [Molorchus minor]